MSVNELSRIVGEQRRAAASLRAVVDRMASARLSVAEAIRLARPADRPALLDKLKSINLTQERAIVELADVEADLAAAESQLAASEDGGLSGRPRQISLSEQVNQLDI